MKKIFLSALSILILAAFTACSQGTMSRNAEGDAPSGGAKPSADGAGPAAPGAAGDLAGGDEPDINLGDYYDCEVGDGEYIGEAGKLFGEDFVGYDALVPDSSIGKTNGITAAAGTLTAGEWIDNDHYSFWQSLFRTQETGWESYRSRWNREYSARSFVTATLNGMPIENETVTLFSKDGKVLWTAKTDNEGKAYLFYKPSELSEGSLTVKTSFGGEAEITSEDINVDFTIDGTETNIRNKSLDLALIVDTTGSMSDELKYLQKELESVISRAAKANGNIPVRLSVTFYRDDGDEYVVRDFDFTDNISEAINSLNAQSSDGGGDSPEKVNAALDAVINKLSWNESSTKLAFIILDAPPHAEDRNAVEEMNSLTVQAAAKGIRLIPILASGGDKETEFLMRDFALKTGGSYLFLTDDSGVSVGGHIEPTVGEYTVRKLNELMVDVINRYLKDCPDPAKFKDLKVETKPGFQQFDQTDASNGVSISLLKQEGSGTDLKVTFTLQNKTDQSYTYGYAYELQQFTDGMWTNIFPPNGMSVIEIAVILSAGSSNEFEAYIGKFFGELDSGRYRIILGVVSGEGKPETLYGEFSVK